jgi:hypothetical protein
VTEEQLNTPLSVQMFRQSGFCTKGTKAYGERLGFTYRDLQRGSITVRDLEPYKDDAFIHKLLINVLGENYGR